jgi:hypothetical protein
LKLAFLADRFAAHVGATLIVGWLVLIVVPV